MFAIGQSGSLTEKIAPMILAWTAVSRYSGNVTITQESGVRSFYFLNGKVIYVTSNHPEEGIIAALVRLKKLNNEQYKAIYVKAHSAGLMPEAIAQNDYDILGGALKEAEKLAARLLIRKMATDMDGGSYELTAGVKPGNGSVLVELDPLFDLLTAAADGISDEAAKNYFNQNNFYLRARSDTWEKMLAVFSSLRGALQKPLVLPDAEIPPAYSLDIIDKTDISPRSLLLLLIAAAIVPSAPREDDAVLEKPGTEQEEAARKEIHEEYQRIKEADYFTVMQLPDNAGEEQIKNSYLALAQKWHLDSFAGLDLGSAAKELQAIFAKINEAKETLLDPKKRESYIFFLERTKAGLPTDVEVILKAEDNFKRAQLCIEQGKYQVALPLLEEAVALNKGEADFWIALALSKVAVQGEAAYKEAMEMLQKADEMDKKFHLKVLLTKGKIELLLSHYKEADKYYSEVLAIQPENEVAQRDKRLITSRLARKMAKEAKEPKSLKELLTGKK